MSRFDIRFSELALEEVSETERYYSSRSLFLGREFVDALEHAIARIKAFQILVRLMWAALDAFSSIDFRLVSSIQFRTSTSSSSPLLTSAVSQAIGMTVTSTASPG